MELGLKDKVALVTGGGSQVGFGKGIATTLAKEGCDIIIFDIDLEGAKKTASDIEVLGRKSIAFRCDIANINQVKEMVAMAIEKFGKIDILVNNAGAILSLAPFVDRDEDVWEKEINLNLKGMMNCSKAVVDHMISRKTGKIISIASIGANKGKAGTSTYGAAKAGVVGFSLALAVELARKGINVNCVSPGLGLTGFAGGNPPPELVKKALSIIPAGRSTTPQDIGNVVAFLASDVSSDIVGQNIHVDGGEGIL